MDSTPRKAQTQVSEFDLDVLEEEIMLLGSAYDELPFDDTPERLKHGRLLIRKFLAYRKAVRLHNSHVK